MDISQDSNLSNTKQVQNSSTQGIRVRIDVLLHERGMKWVDAYKQLGWSKTFASGVRNGHIIPPLWQRVALAKVFLVDSTVIWQEVKNENSG